MSDKITQDFDDFDDVAIRTLFRLPEGGELFDRLADLLEGQTVLEVRLHNAIHNLLAEPVYENGELHSGIATKFLMRLTLLAHEAGLKEYGKDNVAVVEAIDCLGDPAANSPESLAAAAKRRR